MLGRVPEGPARKNFENQADNVSIASSPTQAALQWLMGVSSTQAALQWLMEFMEFEFENRCNLPPSPCRRGCCFQRFKECATAQGVKDNFANHCKSKVSEAGLPMTSQSKLPWLWNARPS